MSNTAAYPPGDPEDVVLRLLEGFNRRDLDEMLRALDEEVDFRPLRLAGMPARCHGHQEIRRWYLQQVGSGDEYRIAIKELLNVGGGEIAAVGSLLMRGEEEVVVGPFVGLYRIAGGRILVGQHYLSDLELIEELGFI